MSLLGCGYDLIEVADNGIALSHWYAHNSGDETGIKKKGFPAGHRMGPSRILSQQRADQIKHRAMRSVSRLWSLKSLMLANETFCDPEYRKLKANEL